MINRSITIETMYCSQGYNRFIDFVTPGIKSIRTTCYSGYSYISSLIDDAVETLGGLIDSTGYHSDFVRVVGTFKK